MKLAMHLTLDGLVRALRTKAHAIAEDLTAAHTSSSAAKAISGHGGGRRQIVASGVQKGATSQVERRRRAHDLGRS